MRRINRAAKWWLVSGSLALGLLAWTQAGNRAAEPDALREFMLAKLTHSQRVLEGLVRGDFDRIGKGAQEMSLLSLAEAWQVLETPQYLEFSRKFRQEADKLSDAARKKNLDAATEAYNRMTTKCVECHKYIRDVRMASTRK